MWERKPVVFLLLATAAILVGTIVTMVLPFAWVNSEENRIEAVVPYAPLELAGRDVYIREGCNNCHTQTVRPLVSDVLRYGPYSKSGEFAYDQPHLWGSRRTGPDLARIGGKYPDSWHVQHMQDPRSLVPGSNMPAYGFLADNEVDPEDIRGRMDALGFPAADEQIAALQGKTEMDAMVAYMQKLGSDIGWRAQAGTEIVGDLTNPLTASDEVMTAGEALYAANCAQCHAADLTGDIGPELTEAADFEAADLFQTLWNGVPDGGMPAYNTLGQERLWQLVTYLRNQGQ
jgi:cytochrome c oxidase cbb3-type subunit 2